MQVPFYKSTKGESVFPQSCYTLSHYPCHLCLYVLTHGPKTTWKTLTCCILYLFCIMYELHVRLVRKLEIPYIRLQIQHLTMDDPWRAITRRDLSSIIWRMWRPYIARAYGTVCQLIYHSYYRRLPVRKDTCRIAAISLNMQEKVHPVIWSLDNLPFDCQKTLPVPKPNGNGFQLQLVLCGFPSLFCPIVGFPFFLVPLVITATKT